MHPQLLGGRGSFIFTAAGGAIVDAAVCFVCAAAEMRCTLRVPIGEDTRPQPCNTP
jgi:hypothetical protein